MRGAAPAMETTIKDKTMSKKLHVHTLSKNPEILREDLSVIKSSPGSVADLFQELRRLCRVRNGVGISANQVGVRENFFFVTKEAKFPDRNGRPGKAENLCINPSWIPCKGTTMITDIEGCLSLPGRRFLVPRFFSIDAEWTNTQGHLVKRRLNGFAARVFQHEHDHLRGVLLVDTGEEISSGK